MKLNLRKSSTAKVFRSEYGFSFVMLLLLCAAGMQATAQVNPLISSYYQNQYINNPAMAGSGKGLNVNLGYNREWVDNDGAPVMNLVTADYRRGNIGLGLYVNAAKDGIINNNKYAVTYAYHLPVGTEQQLSFGLSAGLTTDRLGMGNIVGDSEDPALSRYNDQKAYFDADFGAAFSAKNLTVQAVVQNMKKYFYGDEEAELYPTSSFFTSISYKYDSEILSLEPKVSYRGLRNYDDILDAGMNAIFADEKFNVLAMYHTSKNVTLGLGFTHQKRYQLQLAYTSPTMARLRNYTNGTIELGLKLNFLNN